MSRKYETSGQTPLHVAASCGHTDMVQLLIGAGADIGNMVVFYDSISQISNLLILFLNSLPLFLTL